MFVDSDDFLDKKACEIAYNANGGGHCDIITFGHTYFDTLTKDTVETRHFEKANYDQKDFFTHSLKTYSLTWNVWAKLIKAKLYQKALPFFQDSARGITVAEDALQSFFLFHLAKSFAFVDKELYFYRANPNSSIMSQDSSRQKKKFQDVVKVVAIILQNIKENPSLFDAKFSKWYLYLLKRTRGCFFL